MLPTCERRINLSKNLFHSRVRNSSCALLQQPRFKLNVSQCNFESRFLVIILYH